MPNLLSKTVVAERLGITPATLAKLRVRGGGPPFVKICRRVFYPEDALDAWIAEQPLHRSTAEYAA